MKISPRSIALALVLSFGPMAFAQPPATTPPGGNFTPLQFKIFYLHSDPQAGLSDATNAVRQALGSSHGVVLGNYSSNAIIVYGSGEDIALAQKVVDGLDRSTKAWRITYTVSEMDGDKRVGAQHYSMVMTSGQQTSLKQGDRVPIVTGKTGSSSLDTQITYQDVGMLFTATLDELRDGSARLRSDVEQSSVGPQNQGNVDPVFRHSELKGEATLLPGKPLVLGSMDMPASTHRLQIEVLMEPLP